MITFTHKLAAAVTATVVAGSAEQAFAQGGFSAASQNIITSASNVPNMISTVAYIGGIGLGVAGIFKLKNHVDAPAQHAMKDGLVRLGSGGGLLALPYVTDAMTTTIGTAGGVAPAAANLSSGLSGITGVVP